MACSWPASRGARLFDISSVLRTSEEIPFLFRRVARESSLVPTISSDVPLASLMRFAIQGRGLQGL